MLAAYFICLPCTAVTGTLTPAPLPAPLPVFTPGASVPHGLSLLASVASSTLTGPSAGVEAPRQVAANPTSGLQGRGPFNPVALLWTKLVKKILDLEFVEMSDITLDDLPTPGPGQRPLPARPPIQDITTWVEKFSLMAAILATRFPEKAPELFAYQASIVRTERNFEGRRSVNYDRCYRREALATKGLNWSAPNLRLYNEAFTGHARAIPRCSYCLQEDHTSQVCPRNPGRPWFGMHHEPMGHAQRPLGSRAQSSECCRRYNDGKCRQTANTCRYAHRCQACGGPHLQPHCPRSGQGSFARPRSPMSHQGQAGPPGYVQAPPFPGRRH